MTSRKAIITAAITGSIHTPTMSPYLPITPGEIARSAIDAVNAGAAVVHIHARNPENGMPSPDMELFREIIGTVNSSVDTVICITTGGGTGMTVDQRMAVVPEFRPELASFNTGSMNFALFPLAEKYDEWKHEWEPRLLHGSKEMIFQNNFADLERLCIAMRENGTKPELEVYDVGHLYNIAYLVSAGLLEEPVYLQFVMGVLGGIQPSMANLLFMKQTADSLFGAGKYAFSAFGTGRSQMPICTTSVLLGGNCRVGLEDSLYISKGVLAKSNAEQVEKIIRIIREFGIDPASPGEAREILGIKKKV